MSSLDVISTVMVSLEPMVIVLTAIVWTSLGVMAYMVFRS